VSSSCCWRPAAHRGGLATLGQRLGGVARAEESQRRKAGAVTSLEVTHRSYQSRRWHRQHGSGGEQLRPAVAERKQLGGR
jgi:hypothetical protein